MKKKKSIGLPGGPNEYITHVSDMFSIEGYKRNSPDVNNPYNIIPSGSITMKGVDFPVMGTDNLGNMQMMMPGYDYKFPGNAVFEVPMAQGGIEMTGYYRDKDEYVLGPGQKGFDDWDEYQYRNTMYNDSLMAANLGNQTLAYLSQKLDPSFAHRQEVNPVESQRESDRRNIDWYQLWGTPEKPTEFVKHKKGQIIPAKGTFASDIMEFPSWPEHYFSDVDIVKENRIPLSFNSYRLINQDNAPVSGVSFSPYQGRLSDTDYSVGPGISKGTLGGYRSSDLSDTHEYDYSYEPEANYDYDSHIIAWQYQHPNVEPVFTGTKPSATKTVAPLPTKPTSQPEPVVENTPVKEEITETVKATPVPTMEIYGRKLNQQTGEYIYETSEGNFRKKQGPEDAAFIKENRQAFDIYREEFHRKRRANRKTGGEQAIPKAQEGNGEVELVEPGSREYNTAKYSGNLVHVDPQTGNPWITLPSVDVDARVDYDKYPYYYTDLTKQEKDWFHQTGENYGDFFSGDSWNAPIMSRSARRKASIGKDKVTMADEVHRIVDPVLATMMTIPVGGVAGNIGGGLAAGYRAATPTMVRAGTTASNLLNAPLTIGSTTAPSITANTLLRGGFATDFALNRAPEIPGQIERGEYVDAALNAGMGALDILGLKYFKPPTQFIRGINTNIVPRPTQSQPRMGFDEWMQRQGALADAWLLDYSTGIKRGIKDIRSGRPFFETFPITKNQRLAIAGKQDQMALMGDQFGKAYMSVDGVNIRPGLLQNANKWFDFPIQRRLTPDAKRAFWQQPILTDTRVGKRNFDLTPAQRETLNFDRGRIGGVALEGERPMTVRNYGLYYRNPESIGQTIAHEFGHTGPQRTIISNDGRGLPGGIRWENRMKASDADAGYGYFTHPFYSPNFGKKVNLDWSSDDFLYDAVAAKNNWKGLSKNKAANLTFKNLKEPIKSTKPGKFENQTWYAAPTEVQSEKISAGFDNYFKLKEKYPDLTYKEYFEYDQLASEFPLLGAPPNASRFTDAQISQLRVLDKKTKNILKQIQNGYISGVKRHFKGYNEKGVAGDGAVPVQDIWQTVQLFKEGGQLSKAQQGNGETHTVASGETPLTRDEIFNIPRTVRYENGDMVLQDKPIWDGMLDEVTITPYTQNHIAFEYMMNNKATGGLQPVYPIFDIMTLGLKSPFTSGAKAIQKGIQKAPSKINPRYFTPSSNMYYRGLGKEGMEDALQSGVFRAKPHDMIPARNVDLGSLGKLDMAKRFNATYYSPNFKVADRYGAGYIAEVPKDIATFRKRYKGSDWSMATKDQVPISAGRILKKNWWHGYKPVKELGGSLPSYQTRGETSWLDYGNPMNWGVYTYDDAGTFDQAFTAARKDGRDEFMWYGDRYTTDVKPTPTKKEKPKSNMLNLDNTLDYLVKTRGGTRDMWGEAADTVAYHESWHTMNPKMKQAEDGPARGMFQFEGPAFKTFKNRYKTVANSMGLEVDPAILNATSADQLTPEQQYTAFLVNLIQSRAVLKDFADGKTSVEDLWLQGHKNVEKAGDRESFRESTNKLKREGIFDGYRTLKDGGEQYDTYTVQSGDTLGKIARVYGSNVNDLASLNNIANPNFIKINQKLQVPKIVEQQEQQEQQESSNDFYKVKSGDTLGKIAKKYGTTTDILAGLNNISNPNLIIVNQKLQLPSNYIEEKPLKEESWIDINKLETNRADINSTTDENIIIKAQALQNPNEQYVVIDKKTQRLKLYQGDTPVMDFEVQMGVNPGDAQTVTKAVDKNNDGIITDADKVNGTWETDWSKGNLSTGAGRFTVSSTSPTSGDYYNNSPTFTLKDDRGQEVGTAIHGAPDYRLNYFDNQTLDDNRSSNGCVNGKCSDVQALYNMNLPIGTPVYILPEDEGNYFELVDGKAVLRMSSNNRQSYLQYTDEKGREQKGQGANYSTNTLTYKPIKANFDESLFREDVFQWNDFNDEEELANTTKPFINALVDNKQQIMKVAKISSDAYNQIARMAFGIYGTESNYGDTHSPVGNLARAATKAWDPKNSSSPDVVTKATTYGASQDFRSVGYTQMRWSYLNDREKEALTELGISSNMDLLDPEKAAIATATVLGIRYNEQLTPSQKKDMWNYLPTKWNKRSNYSSRVKSNARFLTFDQFDTMKQGGEMDNNLQIYKDYIDGVYDGTVMQKPATKLYDKLNRKYYREAKNANMNVPNYIMTNVLSSMKQTDN